MTDLLTFSVAALTVLLTPGPTNTLLATGASLLGWRRAAPLVTAELVGYSIAIVALEIVLLILGNTAAVNLTLRVVCATYLGMLAWKLWASSHDSSSRPVTWKRVLVTTLANPKSLVFTSLILPGIDQGILQLVWPFGVLLFLYIGIAGCAWILVGAAVRASLGLRWTWLVRRASAAALGVFSVVIFASTFQLLSEF